MASRSLASVLVGIALAAAACGAEDPRGESAQPQDEKNDSSSVSWRAVGTDIRAARTELGAGATPQFGPVLSEPIDITEPGTFEVRAGPIEWDGPLPELAFSLPPDLPEHADVSTSRTERPRVTKDGGRTYLTFTLVVTSVKQPYMALTIWVQ